MNDVTEPTAREARLGDNSGDEKAAMLMLMEKPELIFSDPSMFDKLTGELEKSLAIREVDLTTETGRKAIGSQAYAIARLKTTIDDAGMKLKEEHQAEVDRVNGRRRVIKAKLEALQAEAKKPLDEWDAQEKLRAERVDKVREMLAGAHVRPANVTVAKVEAFLADVKALEIEEATFGPMLDVVRGERDSAVVALTSLRMTLLQEQADAQELARLRKDEADRLAAESERKSLEQAERDREAAAAREAERADAEAKRIAAAEERAAEKARNDERDRVAREAAENERIRKAEEAAEAKRVADKKHRAKVIGEITAALQAEVAIEDKMTDEVVQAIIDGKIPHVSVKF